jgi:hypothetical protein
VARLMWFPAISPAAIVASSMPRSRGSGRRTVLLGAVVGLLIAMLRASKIQLDYERFSQRAAKRTLLRAIGRSETAMPLSAALRITRLSASRYHGWCRVEAGCDLDDQTSCPRVVPTRLTLSEVETVREMVESVDHRHMSVRALALHAQRIGKVFHRRRRGIGWSEQRAGDAHASVSIRPNRKSGSERWLRASFFTWT